MHSTTTMTKLSALVFLVACGGDTTTNDGGTDASTNDVAVKDTGTNDTATTDSGGCGAAPTTDYYVDASKGSDTNNGGSAGCAFKTITAALTASKTAYNAKIHVAAGTYSAGETFPFVVDAGRSIIGAGASTTTIQGSAVYTTNAVGSFLDATDAGAPHQVTIVAGDVIGGTNSLGATTISNVTILPPSSVTTPTTNYVGIACIAGNGPATGTTPPLPAASLVVQGATVGPNYDVGIAIGSSPTAMTACNAKITLSTITGSNAGVISGACGTANPTSSWPSAQIGDGQIADANTFTANTIGIFGEGCGGVQSYNGNKFVSGYRGIVLVSQAAQYFEILASTFDGATAPNMGIGVNTNAGAVITKMNDNSFTNISESVAADTAVGGAGSTGFGIALGTGAVLQAQRNVIANNDNGLTIGNGLNASFDFSSGGNLVNANQFYCNSKTLGGTGYDLILNTGSLTAANFSGNAWDHAPPSTGLTTASANGTDVITLGTSVINTASYGTAITKACATGRAH